MDISWERHTPANGVVQPYLAQGTLPAVSGPGQQDLTVSNLSYSLSLCVCACCKIVRYLCSAYSWSLSLGGAGDETALFEDGVAVQICYHRRLAGHVRVARARYLWGAE
jgi:hypothetical protein